MTTKPAALAQAIARHKAAVPGPEDYPKNLCDEEGEVRPFTKVLHLSDVAKRWQCSERHVRNLTRSGALPSFRVGGKLIRVPVEAVEAFEKNNLISAPSSAPAGAMPPGENTAPSAVKPRVPNVVIVPRLKG